MLVYGKWVHDDFSHTETQDDNQTVVGLIHYFIHTRTYNKDLFIATVAYNALL